MSETLNKDSVTFLCIVVSLFSTSMSPMVEGAVDRIARDKIKVALVHLGSTDELGTALKAYVLSAFCTEVLWTTNSVDQFTNPVP